jgi:predicted NUDIX family phosphoesterase
MSKSDEQVLGFARDVLPAEWVCAGRFAAAVSAWQLEQRLKNVERDWRLRSEVERNAAFKQVIPYILMRDVCGRVAIYPRGGNEARLHGRFSCGIGGHVNPEDDIGGALLATLLRGAERELAEEFATVPAYRVLSVLGVINEEETEVGHCHFGVVFLADGCQSVNAIAGNELVGLEWRKPDEISEPLEIWSELALSLLPCRQSGLAGIRLVL